MSFVLLASIQIIGQVVYYHGPTKCEYKSLYLDVLNMADMQIDKKGNDVGYDNRLKDIKIRYGEVSDIYLSCLELVNQLRSK